VGLPDRRRNALQRRNGSPRPGPRDTDRGSPMPVVMIRGLVLCALAALAPACHSDRVIPGDASPSGDAVEGVQCGGASGVFPTFDKTCSVPDDCAIGIHQTNCCVATLAIG